ncbi:hypothetical protein FHG87_021353 [Trinorchestia longiramus]|nr:hypothetical protein FHG87_021353 [Trinorchestia longiramus]
MELTVIHRASLIPLPNLLLLPAAVAGFDLPPVECKSGDLCEGCASQAGEWGSVSELRLTGAMVSAENAWLTPSLPSPSSSHPHRPPRSHNSGHLGPQNLDHPSNPRSRNPALADPLLRDPSTQIRDQSSDLPRSVPNLPILPTDQSRVTKKTPSAELVRTCKISPTDSAEAEDELTAETLSSIAAAISTIKELKRESQEIVEASGPAKKTSFSVTNSEETLEENPTSTFYLPKPEKEIQFPAVAKPVESEATLSFHQPSNTSNTTFYLPPPTPEIPFSTQVASSTTVSLSEPTVTSPLTNVTSPAHLPELRPRQSTEIPVIFIKTDESEDSDENLFKRHQPEQLASRQNQQHQHLSPQKKHQQQQQQVDQHHQQHHLQEQQQSKKQKKQEDSATIFHVPLESEAAGLTTGVGGIETLVPGTSGIPTTPQTLSAQFFPSIFPQTSSLLTTFRSQTTTTETVTASTATSSTVAAAAAKTAVFYDTPVVATAATKVR